MSYPTPVKELLAKETEAEEYRLGTHKQFVSILDGSRSENAAKLREHADRIINRSNSVMPEERL